MRRGPTLHGNYGYVPGELGVCARRARALGAPGAKLLASPLIISIAVLYTIPYITPFKEFKLQLIEVLAVSLQALQVPDLSQQTTLRTLGLQRVHWVYTGIIERNWKLL